MKLYPFQKEIIKEIIAKKGRCILALSMGCGKTVITCSFLKCFKKFPKTLIIIPPILYDSWIKHLRQWVSKDLKIQYIATGNDLIDYTAQVYIVSYQLFTKLYSVIPPVDALIMDECFPAGTKISTPFGQKNIEDIKEGDIVLNAIGKGRVKKVGKREVKELITLKLSNRKSITVTPNHLFFTDKGWVQAKDCKSRILLTYSDICYIMNSDRMERRRNYYGEKTRKIQKNLPNMWKNFLRTKIQTKILQQLLCSEVENEPTRNKISHFYTRIQKKIKRKPNKSSQKQSSMGKGIFRKNEKEQSYVQKRNSSQNVSNKRTKRNSTCLERKTRWKWHFYSPTNIACIYTRASRLANGIAYFFREKERRIPYKLQSRYWKQKSKNSYRNRWKFSQGKTEIKRFKKRENADFIRVESIEIYKPRSNDKIFSSSVKNTTVYNLEVEGHPSYFANGVLVHNCHYAKNPRSNRTKAIFSYLKYISPQTPIRLLLTGTPITNKPIDLWSLVSIIDPKIFPSFWAFAKRYCNARKTAWGYWDFSGANNLDELKQKIKPILIRRTWDDIQLDNIPPLIKKPIKVGRATTQISELDSQILIMENGLEKERLKAKQRQLVGMQKIKQVADLCINLLNKTDRVVLFAWHRKVIEGYQEYFRKNKIKAGILYGNLGNKQKIKLINDFRQGKIQVLIINWLSGGVGLNLEFCHVGIFGELDFTPANISQAMMRIFRLTSKHPVFIFFPYLARSYEERIIKILLQKQEIFDKLIKGTKVDQIPFERIGRKIYEKEVKND